MCVCVCVSVLRPWTWIESNNEDGRPPGGHYAFTHRALKFALLQGRQQSINWYFPEEADGLVDGPLMEFNMARSAMQIQAKPGQGRAFYHDVIRGLFLFTT